MPTKAVPFSRRITAPPVTGLPTTGVKTVAQKNQYTGEYEYDEDGNPVLITVPLREYALLYVESTNMVAVETQDIVGVFQGVTLADDPTEVTIDFFLTDPRPLLPSAQYHWDGEQWVAGNALEGWVAFDAAHALAARRILDASHQFTVPTGVNLIGVSDDWVNIQDYKWVAVRAAVSDNPAADVYVQITPQQVPQR